MSESEDVIRQFLTEFWRGRTWQIEQTVIGATVRVPGADVPFHPRGPHGGALHNGPAAQEWRLMAQAAAGDLTRDAEGFTAGEVYETCQKWAEWLFVVPGSHAYDIPARWAETPAGAIWAAALVWSQGDELITISEAAALAGVPLKTIAARVDRGTLQSFVDPASAGARQGRRLVRRRDVLPEEEDE